MKYLMLGLSFMFCLPLFVSDAAAAELETTETRLDVVKISPPNAYEISWETTGGSGELFSDRLEESILFEDGILIDTMSRWREEDSTIARKKKVAGEGSSRYDAFSLHQWRPDEQSRRYAFSTDQLYMASSAHQNTYAFHHPVNEKEAEHKKALDHILNEQVQHQIHMYAQAFDLPRDITFYNWRDIFTNEAELSCSVEKLQTSAWSMYREAFLPRVKRKNAPDESPEGSSMPIIAVSDEHLHLFMVLEDNTPYQLRRPLSCH
ncbi:hypothetical protein B0H94_11626 [Salsuginibacillus halophilus]|uniref:Uncharacterized protein n=1 Tax=Salsuginibacillus halophilus TaxID=517424 RepID=A0A2P8H7W8_9BACI|nr:hypothetical protein [Salsuginibacillus halophilus]PSL42323.1 hypothetical protein B0H94_11626 [Salsuginibacillus halophilus]